MSNLVTSGPVLEAASTVTKGEDTRLPRLRFFIAFLRARPSFAVGYAIVAVVIVVAVLAPWLVPYGPMTADPTVYLLPPGGSHVLGTDGAGMDIFSRVVFAPRVDLAIAIIGTLAADSGTVASDGGSGVLIEVGVTGRLLSKSGQPNKVPLASKTSQAPELFL